MYKQLVLAIFPNETAADRAAGELKGWEKANEEIKRGAIGVLVKDNGGKIKAHKLGTRETTRGAGVGLVLGIIATVLSGGLALLAGVVGGIIVGGIVGSFVHRGLGMSDEDLRLLGEHLDAGRAAVAVLVPDNEAAATSAELKKLGGDITTYQVSEEALQQAAEAAKGAGA
ncbi:MAG: DUF1269 domain-containing protein [Halobacteriota archaeon]|jgi:uncharacterized membrane protein